MTVYKTEGEAKSLSLVEFGVPAVGISGINCATPGGELVAGLPQLLAEWPIDRLVFVGDSDVGINHHFAKAAVALARAVPEHVTVAVIVPGLGAPAKGIDDCREKLGEGFPAYWAKLNESAITVGRKMSADELALTLLRREDPALIRAIYRCEYQEEHA